MKNKEILIIVVLALIAGAFLFPANVNALVADTSAAALKPDTTPPTLTAALLGDTLTAVAKDEESGVEAIFIGEYKFATLANGMASISFKDYAGTEPKVAISATDIAGNRSQPVVIDNPYYNAPSPSPDLTPTPAPTVTPTLTPTVTPTTAPTPAVVQPPATWAPAPAAPTTPLPAPVADPTPVPAPVLTPSVQPQPSPLAEADPPDPNPFTPDGTGTVQDNATGEQDGKEFFTVTSDEGSVYYLVIDRQRNSENVFFLAPVKERDLLALAEKDVPAVPDPEPLPVQTPNPEPDPEPQEEPPKKEGVGAGTIIFILLAALGTGGAAYYFKIVKPRQQQPQEEEEYEDEDEDEDEQSDEYADEGEEYFFGGEERPGAPDTEDE